MKSIQGFYKEAQTVGKGRTIQSFWGSETEMAATNIYTVAKFSCSLNDS